MADKLRECPFCGGRAAIEDVTWEFELMGAYKGKKSWWAVECFDCHARTQAFSIQGKAVEAWQRRCDPYAIDIAKLKKAIMGEEYE